MEHYKNAQSCKVRIVFSIDFTNTYPGAVHYAWNCIVIYCALDDVCNDF